MANNQLKKNETSLVIRDIQIKFHTHQIGKNVNI